MFRCHRWIGILLVLLLLPAVSLASETFYGTVICGAETIIPAPFGGIVTDLAFRKGDLIRPGDQICTIETTPVYSPAAGTVTAVFGAVGDSTEDVKAWRGGVVYIVPDSRFSISASTAEAAKNPDCYVSVGQTVWLRKGRSNSPVLGTGTVTAVSADAESAGS